jgi:ADP-heptose:LPS heptosyltransferase
MRATILLFQFGDLGDTLLTIPAIRAIRNRHAGACLVLLAKPQCAAQVEALGLVDAVVPIDKHAFDRISSLLALRPMLASIRLLWSLRRMRPTTIVVFHHLATRWGAFKFALLALASGAPRRVGLNNGRGWFLTASIEDKGFGQRHEVEYWLDVAGLLDARGEPSLEIAIPDADRRQAHRLLSEQGLDNQTLVALHAGTGWYGPGRRWSAERFAEVAHLLHRRAAVRCVLVGSSQDAEPSASVMNAGPDNLVSLVGRTTVGELAAVLERCTLLIANDGGVGHVASAVKTPVVSIFGPSNDRAWRPLTGQVVAADLPCRPCFYRDFQTGLPAGCATRECLQLVTPDDVLRATLSRLPDHATVA